MAMSSAPPPMPPAPGQPAGPSPTRKTWLPWVIGGCSCLGLITLAAIALIIVLAVLGSGGPEQTVHDHHQAWEEADCEAFIETTTEKYREGSTCEDFATAAANGGEATYEVLGSETDGDTATVQTYEEVTVSETATYTLVRVDGDWKIDGHTFGGD